MRINHNIASLNTYRYLTSNTSATSKSLEKLSSGLRINRAGDDAAGLAISEKMRAQIRGLDMATKNAQDGISLVQTAEGALNETHSILQRMRELAVQSANDTNTDSDRGKLQSEMDQLAKEITRISNTTEFNTRNLLNGGVTDGKGGQVTFQIGANADQNLALSISAMDAASLGVTRNGFDGKLASSGANGITGVKVANNATAASGNYSITSTTVSGKAGTLDIGTGLSGSSKAIHDGSLTISIDGGSGITVNYSSGATLTSLVSGINAKLGSKGTASIVSGGKLEIKSATTGANSNVTISSAAGSQTVSGTAASVSAGSGISGATTAGSSGGFTVTIDGGSGYVVTFASGDTLSDIASGINANFGSGTATITSGHLVITSPTGSGTGSTVSITGASGGTGFGIINASKTGTATTTSAVSGSFGIASGSNAKGADATLNVTLTLSGGTATTVSGVATNATSVAFSNGLTLTKSATVTSGLTGKVTLDKIDSHAATFSGATKTSDAEAFGGIDISTQSGANAAITTINAAIELVSDERSKLGAYQNRLEHTINNLGTTSENLTASESRIRDVDMAKEMMDFTKNNILTQAAQAMLAQANQQPQGVLQLLR